MKNSSGINKNQYMIIAFVVITLIHASITLPVSAFAQEASGAGTAPVTFADER